MPSFIVLGAKYEQVPLMVWARNRGYRVLGVDHNENPDGRAHCDAYFQVSYRDLDQVQDIARRNQVAGVGTIGTNDAICTAAKVNHTLDLPGLYDHPEIIERATYKHLWRPWLADRGLAVARGTTCRSLEDLILAARDLGYPLLLKPGDASGCKGLRVLHGPSDLEEAFAGAMTHSRYKTAVVEEFIGHNSLAVESFVLDGQPHLLAISERILAEYPNCTGIGCIIPDNLDGELRTRIADLSRRAIEALGLTHGPIHMDMVVDANRNPHIVDIGPRCIAGPLGWAHIPAVTGFHIVGGVFGQALGKRVSPPGVRKPSGYFAHRYITADRYGTLESVDIDPQIRKACRILSLKLTVRSGDVIRPIRDSSDRLGIVTVWGPSYQAVRNQLETFVASIRFRMRKDAPLRRA